MAKLRTVSEQFFDWLISRDRRTYALAALSVPALVTSLVITVHSGDTLSGLAARYCHGQASDWTGIYHVNRAVIGSDPNLILPGQRLAVSCTHADPPGYTPNGQPAGHGSGSGSGRVWDVTYGDPNYCGDGDGDGWDVACGSQAPSRLVTVSASQGSSPPAAVSYGTYSYGALEALWVSAGGPAWAEAHAAEIAECESGGRVNAYNSSGATGLWQILGQVVGGSLWNPYTNALNAVAKFTASGDTFAQWVCQ
jgi:LysM domain